MSDEKYRISGRIIDHKSRRGIAGLTVEAWEKGWRRNKPVGGDTTDESGIFRIRFDKNEFQRLFENRHPELYFKVIQNDDIIENTEDSILWSEDVGEDEIIIRVGIPPVKVSEEIAKEKPEKPAAGAETPGIKECISEKFSENLDIFDDHYGYPVIDKEEKYKGRPTGKVIDILGIQAHAGRDFFVPEGKEFSFEIDECPYLHIAIKAEKETKTCLLLMVHDKEPDQHKNRFVVIGKTHNGDPGIYDVIEKEDRLTIKDDGKWHDEYCFDLRKIRNKFQNAGSISIIEFYSWIGSAEHSFHFIDLICKSDISPIKSITVSPTLVKTDEKITVTAIVEPGGRARFSIAQVPGAADKDMEENPEEPGTYSGYYVAEKGDDIENAAVTVVFTSRIGETFSQKAEQTVTIDTTPPKILEYSVEGKVASSFRAGVGGLRVEIVDKNIGGDVRLDNKAVTDDNGDYLATFKLDVLRQRGKQRLDLQARVFTGKILLGASDVRYNASNRETLNILLTEEANSALPSEHETLTGALFTHFQGNLRDLKETDDTQDITYLANKTGWDARAVALAALADQFSAKTAETSGPPKIEPAFFYALFRAGLPANEDIVYHADAKTLEGVWKTAAEQGVIPKASVDQIPNVIERFQSLSAQKLLTGPIFIGASSINEMLRISRLNEQQQEKFAELYAANRADMSAFWKAVGEDKIFGATPDERGKTVTRLQVDGKLGFLTINNAPLMQKMHTIAGANGLSDPLQLAQMGYHRAEPWNQLLTPDIPIPKEIPGDTPESKRANFAEYLGAQVRLSYPTAAVAQMVKNGEIPLTGAASGASDKVHAFLTEHQGKFEIGVHSIQQYIKDKKLTDADVAPETVKQVMRLQRVYQITPSDQALTGLMKRGIDAAYHIVRYDKDTFIQSLTGDLGGADHAALTYDKSVQIHNAVLNIALSYLTARTAPAIGVHSPAQIVNPTPQAANASDIIAYSTLETLFNSMDFCACDHCRSILSPAAYLVDLLLFIDQKVPPLGKENPQTVLLERRPDIQYLPLTCENTNTALPYIDVVNETLEYFIANDTQKLSLNGYLGYDINGVASEDLLASPQFIMDSAYKILRDERFPTPLPFHQPLENLRRYFNKFEVPLQLAMERLRKTEDLERGANLYGWRDILMEELSFSRAEYEILTNSTAVPLWRMCGFPNGIADADVIAGLSNAKQFARRIGITYEDLVSVLRTRFINPNSDLIPKLERLGVNFAMLAELKTKNDAPTDAKFDALLAALAVPPDPVMYGGDPNAPKNDYTPIRNWVKNNDNYARIMGLITLTIPTDTWAKKKVYAVGDCVLPTPTAAQSESTLYYECTTSGTSADLEPKPWPTTSGNTYTDGTVVWTCRDASSCHSFDNLAFRYSDPAKLTENIRAVEFVRLLRFIRLWKKLGWTIEQTDAAICALYREDLAPLDASDINDVVNLDTGFLRLLPRLGLVKRVMMALNLKPKSDLLQLLACFSLIYTHDGMEWFVDKDQSRRLRIVPSLYRQLFLNPAVLKQDPVFKDNGYGEFLQDQSQMLLAMGSVQKTMVTGTITVGDVLTTVINGVAIPYQVIAGDTTPIILTTKIVSAINATTTADPITGLPLNQVFLASNASGIITIKAINPRSSFTLACSVSLGATETYVTLNHEPALRAALNLTSDEFSLITRDALKFDETTPLSLVNISKIFRWGWLARKLKLSVRELLLLNKFGGLDPFAAPNLTNPAILRLIELVQSMRGQSLKSAVVLYLIWNQDLSGKSAPDPAQMTEFARTLRGDFASIEDQFATTEDTSGDIARARITLVYGQETADTFFALLDDTLILDVAYTHPTSTLEAAITAADPKIAYDDFRHRLSYTGVLTAEHLKELKNKLKNIPGVTGKFQNAVDALFARSEDVKGSFFGRCPELKPLYEAYVADTADPPAKKRSALLAAFSPELSRRRKRQQAWQRFSAAANTDLIITQALLDPPAPPYPLHASGHIDQPAMNDILALETPGLSALFFYRDAATGAVDKSIQAAANLDYASGGSNPLPTNPTLGAAISGIWSGQIEAPEAGFYNFVIETDAVATVTLSLDGKDRPLIQNSNVWRNNDPLDLKAGTLYEIVLTINKVKDKLSVKWETPKRAREVIDARYLYPPTILESFSGAYVRFLKAASLAKGLDLTAKEMSHFAIDPDYQITGDGWLNAISVRGDPAIPIAVALLKPLRDLLDYARIKTDISPADESLLSILQDPVAATAKGDSLLFIHTRWDRTSLNDVLAYFGDNFASLAHFDKFRRIYDSFAFIQTMGISAKVLIQATTNEPISNTVRDLQAALRARYDANDWRTIIQPINDEMRGLQRDALIAYILHQMRSNSATKHIDTADKLFEYFLMDVQMEPCMQTSRIRHALSSVQLFIESCLMNLEPRVSPASITATQWEWMKRYRVWEANRKVFLFPENWLEPELRDDKSPFFKEIESELLQSDITEDSATTAFLNYLARLEEVAKLEPCSIYHQEGDPNKRTGDIDHIIARTAGAHRKYYYRRHEYGNWTPWEQIKLDIEDNPVIPVVWKSRLLLFWLRILKAPIDRDSLSTSPGPTDEKGEKNLANVRLSDIKTSANNDAKTNTKLKVHAVLCWSEYYKGKWQATKTSDIQGSALIDTFIDKFDQQGSNSFDRSKLMLSVEDEDDESLRVKVSYQSGEWDVFFRLYNTHSLPMASNWPSRVSKKWPKVGKSRVLEVEALSGPYPFTINYHKQVFDTPLKRQVLMDPSHPRTIEPLHPLTDIWGAPFFFEDLRNVFFVTTTEEEQVCSEHAGYGFAVSPSIVPKIPPPLVVQPGPPIPPTYGGPIGPDPGIVDPAMMQRFITEDAYIHQGIGTTGGVKYGDRQIGPSGAISNRRTRM